MNKILPLISTLSVNEAPVLLKREGECFLSKKNKASQDEMIEQFDCSHSSER